MFVDPDFSESSESCSADKTGCLVTGGIVSRRATDSTIYHRQESYAEAPAAFDASQAQ